MGFLYGSAAPSNLTGWFRLDFETEKHFLRERPDLGPDLNLSDAKISGALRWKKIYNAKSGSFKHIRCFKKQIYILLANRHVWSSRVQSTAARARPSQV